MSELNLFKASHQWSSRPADERFASLEEMRAACFDYYQSAAEAVVPFGSLRVRAEGEELMLAGERTEARFTHYAFGQIAAKAGAPAEYLRGLPPALAAENLNFGLERRAASVGGNEAKEANLLFHKNGGLILRAALSSRYSRIWNYEIVDRCKPLTEEGWRVPPARPAFEGQPGTRIATEADCLQDQGFGLSIKPGDLIAPAGLYASDHDCFIFLINENFRIDDGSPEGLSRGVIFENSEVGDRALRRTTFLYRHVCGNHIIWGAKNVQELSIRHIGEIRGKFAKIRAELRTYAESGAGEDEGRIKAARFKEIAASKEEILDAVFKLRVPNLTKKAIGRALELAEEHEATDGNPRAVWGISNGLTRASQETPFADERHALDRAAGKVLQIAF